MTFYLAFLKFCYYQKFRKKKTSMEIPFPYQIIGQTIQSEIISYWRLCFIVIIVGFVWKKPKKRFSLFRDVKQNISLSLSLSRCQTQQASYRFLFIVIGIWFDTGVKVLFPLTQTHTPFPTNIIIINDIFDPPLGSFFFFFLIQFYHFFLIINLKF